MSTHGGSKDKTDPEGNDLLHRFSHFIDNNIKIINNAISLCGGIGICVVLYSIRIHKRFTCFSQVPDEFIQKHFNLRGQVRSVKGDHLLVEHKPIMSFKNSIVPQPLKIHLAGVEYSREGVQFLEQHSLNKQVWFRLIQLKSHEGINCIVSVRKSMFNVWNLNEEILRHGYGRVVPLVEHSNNKYTIKLTQRLLQAEMFAERKKKGLWMETTEPQKNFKIILFLKNKFHKITSYFRNGAK